MREPHPRPADGGTARPSTRADAPRAAPARPARHRRRSSRPGPPSSRRWRRSCGSRTCACIEDAPAPPPAVTSLVALLTDAEGRHAPPGGARRGPGRPGGRHRAAVGAAGQRRRARGPGHGGVRDGPDRRRRAASAADCRADRRRRRACRAAPPRRSASSASRHGQARIARHGADARERRGPRPASTPTSRRYPLAPPIEAVRLGVYALVRLDDVDALRSAVLAADGQPVERLVAAGLRAAARPECRDAAGAAHLAGPRWRDHPGLRDQAASAS